MAAEKLDSGCQRARAAADFPPDFSEGNRVRDYQVRPRAGAQRLCWWHEGLTVSSDMKG